MDLNYVSVIEKENEELRDRLARTQELLEESRRCFAGRRYHIIVETPDDVRNSGALHLCGITKSEVLKSMLIAIMKKFDNPSEINEIMIECRRNYADQTIIEWRWNAFKRKDEWFCESFKIRGIDRVNLENPNRTDWVPDLNELTKGTI